MSSKASVRLRAIAGHLYTKQALTLLGGALVGLLASAGIAGWLPRGATGVDHISLATLLAPLLMAAVGVALVASRRPRRAWAVACAATAVSWLPHVARWLTP